MAYDPGTLASRIGDLRDPSTDDAVLGQKYGLRDVSYWNLNEARAQLREVESPSECIKSYCYRPFDFRYVFYHPSICERPRLEVMRHMQEPNLALLTHRPQSPGDFTFAYCTRMVGDQCVAANKTVGGGNSFQFPLYLYPTSGGTVPRDQRVEDLKNLARRQANDEAQRQVAALVVRLFPEPQYSRWPNLNPFLLAELEDRVGLRFIPDGQGDLTSTFGPEDVFGYIYAVLHCPAYRSRYAEFLKRDFPRVPFTRSRDLFAALVAKGRDLVALHVMESPSLNTLITSFPERGSDTVERVSYSASERRVYINETQYFDRVPKEVWEFHVGGYQVCEKWLKDRRGRKLSNEDLLHYQKIVVALRETIRLMAEIDAFIPSWPIA